MSTKLISGTSLQLLRRYDNRPESYRAQLLDDVNFPPICLIIIHLFCMNSCLPTLCRENGEPGTIFFTLYHNNLSSV